MLFKVYNQDGNFIIIESIHELSELCGITTKQARSIFYKKAATVNGFEIINYSH